MEGIKMANEYMKTYSCSNQRNSVYIKLEIISQNKRIKTSILDEFVDKQTLSWVSFGKKDTYTTLELLSSTIYPILNACTL